MTTGNEGAQGGNEGAATPWFADDQKDYVATKGWKTPADVVNSNRNLETLLGADKAGRAVILPKDDNDADGIKAFRSKIGVPEKADGYTRPESLKDDPIWPLASELALEFGLPAKSFVGFVDKLLGRVKEQDDAAELKTRGEATAALDTLKGEWGGKFDERAEFARRFVKAIGWDEKKIDLFERTFGTAAMLKDFFAFGSRMGEHGFSGAEGGDGGAPAKTQVQTKLDELRQRRIKGEITQEDYINQANALGKQLDAAA